MAMARSKLVDAFAALNRKLKADGSRPSVPREEHGPW